MGASPVDLAERVVAGLATLADLGETVEDERQYVRDLVLVWTARLRVVANAMAASGRPVADELEPAIDVLCDEASRIVDPHRAIDWLSTLPQAAIVAFGEAP